MADFKKLTYHQRKKLSESQQKAYWTQYYAIRKQHRQEGYKKGIAKRYEKLYYSTSINDINEAFTKFKAVVSEKLNINKHSTRFLAKQYNRLLKIRKGLYNVYWSETYRENYINALQTNYNIGNKKEGDDLAKKLRELMNTLSDDEIDILFSELPELDAWYDKKRYEGMNEKANSAIKSFEKKHLTRTMERWENKQ